ncbi:hypothetical protein [Sphingomonas pituitosa]|uniref:hypothetical protein n=1 Tax=Sphingomonas pituitosa TaxID=99597 RepID=UPI00083221C2|nr:hypothetical protein [Sphingomonas pituitosa]
MHKSPLPEQAVPMLRWRWIAALSVLSVLPFLFVRIPPLTDAPGHIGRFAVQLAPAESVLHRYFAFAWRPTLNLAADLIVQALHPLFGPIAAMWLVCAAVPVLTVLGLLAVARQLNPRGSAALPWALIFVYNSPFLWGFVNYSFTAALALCGFALWIALERRAALRGALFLPIAPALFLGHGEGGALLLLWVAGYEAARAGSWWRPAAAIGVAARLWPFVAVVLPLAVARGDGGTTAWDFPGKLDELTALVRDQHAALDIATVAAALAVLLLGRLGGARIVPAGLWPVLGTVGLFLAAPLQLAGTNNVDMRLAPYAMMLALALQDWHPVSARRRRLVLLAGAALLAVRFGITTASFLGYQGSYARELAALDHVAPGSRVLNLVPSDCGLRAWRQPRLTHLAALATAERQAWTNAHWAVASIHLLQVRYAPPGFATDPSQLVSPADCVGRGGESRQAIVGLVPRLPLDAVDYVWLIDVQLPPGAAAPRLVPIWRSGGSTLYAVRPRVRT